MLGGIGTHIKPKFGDRSIIGEQFRNLLFRKLMVLRGNKVTVMAGNGIGLWKMPINQREIHAEIDASAFAGFCQFFYEIAFAGSGIVRVIVGSCRLKHTEAVMMFGCEDDGTHSGFFSQGNDGVSMKKGRVETECRISIPVTEDAGKRLYLFTVSASDRLAFPYTAQFGIKSEMDKHGVFILMPAFLRFFSRCRDEHHAH